jgi:hypothetical protein
MLLSISLLLIILLLVSDYLFVNSLLRCWISYFLIDFLEVNYGEACNDVCEYYYFYYGILFLVSNQSNFLYDYLDNFDKWYFLSTGSSRF